MQVTATDINPDLVTRIARLEARIAIRELVARYCFTVDERDIDGIAQCFTQDGVMRSVDGVMNAAGREAVIAQFHGRLAALSTRTPKWCVTVNCSSPRYATKIATPSKTADGASPSACWHSSITPGQPICPR